MPLFLYQRIVGSVVIYNRRVSPSSGYFSKRDKYAQITHAQSLID